MSQGCSSFTTNDVEHAAKYQGLDVELGSVGFGVEMSDQYGGLLVEYMQEFFENLEVERWSDHPASLQPLVAIAVGNTPSR
jgi:hypothetical protein